MLMGFYPAFRGIMWRGIERIKIFLNDVDREDFIARLASLALGRAMDVYAMAE